MPEDNTDKKQNFAGYGKETFKIGEEAKDSQTVTLHIEEAEAVPIKMEKRDRLAPEDTGNPIVDIFNRINFYLIKKSKIKVDVKATFFHLLSVMINSGMPMVKALTSLVHQMEDSPKMRYIMEEMADGIASGSSLSEALENYPDVFSDQDLGMIQAGEASGQIAKVLETLAHDTEKASSIRKKVKSAMTYPIVIFTLLIAVIVVMLMYVIPQLTELFTSSGATLPLVTRIVVGLSDFLINQKIVLAGMLVAIIVGYTIAKKTPQGKYAIDKVKISIPIFGTLFKKSYLSRFARSLSNLLDSSVSIVKTIEITANSIGNEVYKKRLLMSMEDIKQGIPLAENLTESPLFPPMLVSMIEVGEKTAQLDTITAKVADFYENEVDTTVEGLSKIIEPIILVIIGLTVGTVVAAIILPIMELSNIAQTV